MRSFVFLVLWAGIATAANINKRAGSCADKLPNCSAFGQTTCQDTKYTQWVDENCKAYCGKCGGMTGPGVGGGSCADVSPSCAQMKTTGHICTDASARIYAKQNCALTCGLCASNSGPVINNPMPSGPVAGGSCADAISNCAAYSQSVCTDPTFGPWVAKNCAKFCHKCADSSGNGGNSPGVTPGGSIGHSNGCVYGGKVYTQGQQWKDGCKYRCTCSDGATGKYTCNQICVTWKLPQQCHLDPAAAGKCCPTPNCPAGYNIQYPAGYVAE